MSENRAKWEVLSAMKSLKISTVSSILFLFCFCVFLIPQVGRAQSSWPVTYKEQVAFKIFASVPQKTAAARAQEAQKALAAAIEAEAPKEPNAPIASYELTGETATLNVRGFFVMTLYEQDATEAGYPDLKSFSEHLTTILGDFVPRQREKAHVQSLFTHLFLSVFLLLIGFVVLRQIHRSFNQFDHLLDERKDSIKPFAMMSETLLTGEALGALLAIGLAIGRVVAYLVTVITVLAVIMGQFSYTRSILLSHVATGIDQVLKGLGSLAAFVPNIIIAFFIFVLAQAGYKVLDLFLKGVRSGRIQWKLVPAHRIQTVRIVMSLLLFIVSAMFILGVLFGSFQTPFETIILAFVAVLLVSLIPSFANWTTGFIAIWRYKIKPGDWLQIGEIHGEVSSIDPGEISLVPLHGGSVTIPMIRTAVEPIVRRAAPTAEFLLEISSSMKLEELVGTVEKMFSENANTDVQIKSFGQGKFAFHIYFDVLTPSELRKMTIKIDNQLNGNGIQILNCNILSSLKG